MSTGGRYPHRRQRKGYRTPRGIRPSHAVPAPKLDPALQRVLKGLGIPGVSPFNPDSFQLNALAATAEGDCLVTVPTGAGKTWIAIRAIEAKLGEGKRAWYACPLKALSNDKFREFKVEFGADRVGILTGDRKENPDAPVIVGTTEILRNQLYDAMHTGESLNVDFLVLDEAHYLGDPDRGVVWEEVIIYLPKRIPLLLLSATIGNAEEIAAWLESIRGRACKVIKETKRPVPLYHLFYHPEKGLLPFFVGKDKGRKLHPDVFKMEERGGKRRKQLALNDLGVVLDSLKKADLLPAIFFLKSRANCDAALSLCRHYQSESGSTSKTRRKYIDQVVAYQPYLGRHPQMGFLDNQAIGAHHAGQLPGWRLLIESLMNMRVLDAVFATSTVAAGVNFPARTVVFFNSDRFNGKEFLPLSATEFHQMTGRAGRRGMDRIGFTLAIPGRYMDLGWVGILTESPPTDIRSQIQINFSMTLNLLLSHSPDQVTEMLRLSFAAFQSGRDGVKLIFEELEGQFFKHLAFLTAHGFVKADGSLTDDGVWASKLRTDQPLLIAEGLRKGLFSESSPSLLAAILSAFMNDKESEDSFGGDEWIDDRALLAITEAVKGLRSFVDRLRAAKFEVRSIFLRPAMALYHWAKGEPWEKVCRLTNMAEGDFAMLVLRTADCLRHVEQLSDVFPGASASARSARQAIMREPVVEDVPLIE